MGTIPVARPTPLGRPRFPRRELALLMLAAAAVVMIAVFVLTLSPENADAGWVTLDEPADYQTGVPVREPKVRAYIVRQESGELVAFSTRSTHLGCTIGWRPELVFAGQSGWFRDPCGGANWDVTGQIFSGPAPRNMDRYVLDGGGGQVRVNTRQIVCGDGRQVTRPGPDALWPCGTTPYDHPSTD